MTAEQRWFMVELERQGGEGDALPIWNVVDGNGGVGRADEVAGQLELAGYLQITLTVAPQPERGVHVLMTNHGRDALAAMRKEEDAERRAWLEAEASRLTADDIQFLTPFMTARNDEITLIDLPHATGFDRAKILELTEPLLKRGAIKQLSGKLKIQNKSIV